MKDLRFSGATVSKEDIVNVVKAKLSSSDNNDEDTVLKRV